MATSRMEALPAWIKNSYTSSHIQSVLATLAEREEARYRARTSTVTPTDLRKTERAARAISNRLHGSSTEHYSVSQGSHPSRQHQNRYMDVLPYDRTRVVVEDGTGDDGQEDGYLNASWVLERFGGKWWIASQAPLPNTSYSFLSLLARPSCRPPSSSAPSPLARIRTVVQLTQNREGGRRKAHPYFPSTVGQTTIVTPEDPSPSRTPLKVTLLASEEIGEACCLKSMISVSYITLHSTSTSESSAGVFPSEDAEGDDYGVDEERGVTFQHLLFRAWPDHGVPDPEDREMFFAFLRLVDSANRDTSLVSSSNADSPPDPDPPIIVGCSAGIGRTGSFITLSSILRAHNILSPPSNPTPASSVLPDSALGPLPETFKDDLVVQEIDSLREQRPGMVQLPEQTLFVYETLATAFGQQHQARC